MTKNWLSKLKAEFPAKAVRTDEASLQANAGDAWMAEHRPEAVVFPANAKQVAQLAAFCHRHEVPLTPRGAGRGYVGGAVPVHGGVVANLARLNKILEIHAEDGIAVVQPAVVTGDLQDAVEAKGLFYPPDPASLKECSIGGNVATNAGGPRCVKYGVTRHYILGLQVALMNGDLVRVGGRTHKNKQGFDLVGLFVGSEGMLGLVTEITVRLLPRPQARAVLRAGFKSMKACAAAVQGVLQAGLLPSSLEIADRYTLAASRRHLGDNLVPDGEACLLVELDGQKSTVAAEAIHLSKVIRKLGGLDIRSAVSQRDRDRVWALRREMSNSLKAGGFTKLNEDITVPRSRLVDLIDFSEKLMKKHRLEIASFGHAGDGNIHVNLMIDPTDTTIRQRADRALDELFNQVLAWGGVITGEHGVGLAKKRWWPQATSKELRALHQAVKTTLDPKGMLNPGKFVDVKR
ncbi:MAG: FAD-linked oxidase C-terminal domain-containing protein [Verrucomicrobiota bacterium]